MESERKVPLKLCVTIVCVLGAVACTFIRIPGNVACALLCVGLAMALPDIMIDLPKTADQLLEEALEENRALKALLKSDMDASYSTSDDSDSDRDSESDASKCSRHTL
jgi:hypothetical protein